MEFRKEVFVQLRRFPVNLIFLTAALLTYGCHHVAKVATAPPPQLPPVQSPSGKTYTRSHIAPADDHEPVDIPPVPPGAAPNTDNFHGTARKAAKLSIATGTPKSFSDVGALLDSLIPDAKMRAMKISKGADSGRLPQEQKSGYGQGIPLRGEPRERQRFPLCRGTGSQPNGALYEC